MTASRSQLEVERTHDDDDEAAGDLDVAAILRDAARARAEAEAAHRRVAFLAEASERLARTRDVDATLRTVADLAVPALANWCFVETYRDDGSVGPIAVAHEDPAKVAWAREVIRRYPIDLEAPYGTGHVLRTGEPELVPEITDELLASVAQDDEHHELLRGVGFRSSLSVPLRGEAGRPVAVLSLVSTTPGRRYADADLALAREVARRAEVALAGARLHAAEQAALRRATALQRVTAALSGTLALQQAAAVVVEQGALALGARAGVVVRAVGDGDELEVVQSAGIPEAALSGWRRFSADAPAAIAEAARTREPVFVESVDAWRARYGESGLLAASPASASWVALPLGVEGRLLGVLGFSLGREGALAADDRAFAIALAQQCALALERARLFEAERTARREAEEANRAKSQFLAVMSHELRTPLNAIGGYAELLEMEIRGPVTPEQREDLRRIQRSQKHLLGLINEVLNYARLETGTVRYDIEPVPVAAALATVESLITPQVRSRGLSLAVAGCDAELAVRADAEKLQQVLLNLLSNAVKFTPPGGRITVSCRATGAGAGAPVELMVSDTGVGIPRDQHDAVFEPFVQVGRTLHSGLEGTGLGLAISRDLARGMGGDLTVESEVGAGSTFTLRLARA